ncbi:MAG: hypothetical protein ABH851_05500 [Methanobacteriota archaeon]
MKNAKKTLQTVSSGKRKKAKSLKVTSLFKRKPGTKKIRATKQQAQKYATESEQAGLKAREGFKKSTAVFLLGFVPLGLVGLFTAFTVSGGNIKNTLLFIAVSVVACIIFGVYLSKKLEKSFTDLENTIAHRGLSHAKK